MWAIWSETQKQAMMHERRDRAHVKDRSKSSSIQYLEIEKKNSADWSIACRWFCAGCVESISLDKFFGFEFDSSTGRIRAPLGTVSELYRLDFSGYCRLLLATRHTKLEYMRTIMFYSFDGNDINFGISANAYCTHARARTSNTAQRHELERCVSVHADCGFVHVRIIYPIF